MTIHMLGQQWASIVLSFEVAVAYQKRKILLNQLDEKSDFNKAGLAVLEKGLTKAQSEYRKNRFAFWRTPYVATSQILLFELFLLKTELLRTSINEETTLSGGLAALNICIDMVMDKLFVTSPDGHRILIPGYHD